VALSVFREVQEDKVEPNQYTLMGAIEACDRHGEWQQALLIALELWQSKLEPDIVSLSATIKALVSGRHRQQTNNGKLTCNMSSEAKPKQ